MSDTDESVDRLYGLPLDEFTQARNQLAQELKRAGDEEGAARVKKLQKPSVSAWAVNQLSRSRPDDLNGLLEVQSSLADAGSATQVRELTEQRRDLVARLVKSAEAILTAEGQQQSAVLSAQGQKQAVVLNAEADRAATILQAEAEREALLLRAEGEALAIAKVVDAIKNAGIDETVLAYQRQQLLPRIADGEAACRALDRAAAQRAVDALASEVGLELLDCAEGIVRVANAEMVRALRVMTVEQGIDPRRFALLAFGGAGPLHAAAVADELGMTTILCPRASGVLSALGLAAADRRASEQRTVLLAGAGLTDAALDAARGELAAAARATLGGGEDGQDSSELEVAYEVRYRGQAHELTVRDLRGATVTALRETFEAQHADRYGYRDADTPIEVVTIRATARVPAPELDLAAGDAAGVERTRRTVVFGGEEHDAEIVRGEPAPGEPISGPAVCELPEATLAVPPGWSGRVDDTGTIVLEREGAPGA
ncbi:MAG: hypothetical protein KY463_08680 [Actinobacteria bacterium]|nr:hypothetical protein [Actinomycetota bacterium]